MPTATTTCRSHRFDGSERKKGLSKLMIDIYAKPIQQRIKNEITKMKDIQEQRFQYIISEVSKEMGIPIDVIRDNKRRKEHVDARAMIVFLTRWTTTLSLNEIGKEISTHLPKDHSTVIHATRIAFNYIHAKDLRFGFYFYRIRQRLEAHYGIQFDINDYTGMPKWYSNMLEKLSSVEHIEDITEMPEEHKIPTIEKIAQYENKIAENNDVTDAELKSLAKQKGVLINRKWQIPNTMWWIVNELGEYEKRLGNTNEQCKQALLSLP